MQDVKLQDLNLYDSRTCNCSVLIVQTKLVKLVMILLKFVSTGTCALLDLIALILD